MQGSETVWIDWDRCAGRWYPRSPYLLNLTQDTAENCFSCHPVREVGPEGEVGQKLAPGNYFRSFSSIYPVEFRGRSQRSPERY